MPIYHIKAKIEEEKNPRDTRYILEISLKKRNFPNPLLKEEIITLPSFDGRIDFKITNVYHHLGKYFTSDMGYERNRTDVEIFRISTREKIHDLATQVVIENAKDAERDCAPWNEIDYATLALINNRCGCLASLQLFPRFLQIKDKVGCSSFQGTTAEEKKLVSIAKGGINHLRYEELKTISRKWLDNFFNLSQSD